MAKLSVLHWFSSGKDEPQGSTWRITSRRDTASQTEEKKNGASGRSSGRRTIISTAMAAPQASSRLELLQARFQQKQLQEKEQKLLQLYDQQQQRAYQVVQRASPGSNGSSHSTTISQHAVTKTASNGHTTSTSQGGKVRQMFDERRQTTVKGIDRSYPLEPLENKPRKQTNGNVQKNGILTLNRQPVTVKRVVKADVNSNLNGGKPVVSYHEKITRESFGHAADEQQDEDEFGNENHVTRFSSGNNREEAHFEEVLDEDTIERNRMMAKLHLMGYDETLKHHVKNDLESEEFPEDFMVDVPDKLPKQSVTKKLSPAEARLERFKNANAKRGNRVTKNQATLPKKRSDPVLPAKSTPSEDRTASARERSGRSSREGTTSPANGKTKSREMKKSWNAEKSATGKDDGLRFFCVESEKSATTYAIGNNAELSTESSSDTRRRDTSPEAFSAESVNPIRGQGLFSQPSKDDSKKRSESPKFFRTKSRKSAFEIDSNATRKLTRETLKDIRKRSESPAFVSQETEEVANTYEIASNISDTTRPRSPGPEFFRRVSEKSAATYSINSRSRSESPELIRSTKRTVKKAESKNGTAPMTKVTGTDAVGCHGESRDGINGKSPSLSSSRNHIKSEKDKESKSTAMKKSSNVFERLTRQRSSSPQFFPRNDKISARSVSPKDPKLTPKSPKNTMKRNANSSVPSSRSPEVSRKSIRNSNASPQFYASDSERSASVLLVRPETIIKSRGASPDVTMRGLSPAPHISKSGAIVTNTVATTGRSTPVERRSEDSKGNSTIISVKGLKISETRCKVRSADLEKKLHSPRGSSPLSLKDMGPPSAPRSQLRQETQRSPRARSPEDRNIHPREDSPVFFCYETEKSAATISLKPVESPRRFRSSKSITDNAVSTSEQLKDPRVKKNEKVPNGTAQKSSLPNDSRNKLSKSHRGKSPPKESGILNRRGSENVLRSTKLIREVIRGQTIGNREDRGTVKPARGSRSSPTGSEHGNGIRNGSGQRPKRYEAEEEMNRKLDETASRELFTAESGTESCKAAEVDVIRGIAVPDRSVKQEHPRGTYSRLSNRIDGEHSRTDGLFTYSVRRPAKKRESLLRSDVVEPSTKRRGTSPDLKEKRVASGRETQSSSRSPSPLNGFVLEESRHRSEVRESKIVECRRRSSSTLKGDDRDSKGMIKIESHKRDNDEACSRANNKRGPSPTVDSPDRPKRVTKDETANRKSEIKVCKSGGEISNFRKERKISSKEMFEEEWKKRRSPSPRVSKQAEILRSMELVRRAMKSSSSETKGKSSGLDKEEKIKISRSRYSSSSTMIGIVESGSDIVSVKGGSSTSKSYERTDSVQSALRRFDSIGAESVRSNRERSKESLTTEKRTESNRTTKSDTKAISLKELDRSSVHGNPGDGPSKTFSRMALPIDLDHRGGESKTREQKKIVKARDSIEIARIAMKSKSPPCKRKLFREDADSEEETETGSYRSKRSLDPTKTVERSPSWSNKNETPESAETVSTQFEFTRGDAPSIGAVDRQEMGITSTGEDRPFVKQLRSIEDIRKSIRDEKPNRGATSGKSTIANDTTRRAGPRQINIVDRNGNGRELSLPGRSENVAAKNEHSTDADRSSVKCTLRFSRVAKSPSPEATKVTDATRGRRNVPASPSKSPDNAARRPSTELKSQDTKSAKRQTPTKATEPIGNRKTTMTARKSTDVVDGAILENALHLRGQAVETKCDNDSATTKKSDAFVIDFDDQSPKENDAPPSRKQSSRKQSAEKQVSSVQSTRSPSSMSSASGGSTMQPQTSGSKSKISPKMKTPASKGILNKSGGNPCSVDQLVPCKVCGRRFAQDRVARHEQICTKTGQKKRKQFDTMLFRVKGTDLEPFVKKSQTSKKRPEKSKKPEVKSNWRRKHEDFINAIRSAKQMQAHLAAGGKLSDLPPPPVSDTSDYIQCPHCGRKFNKSAADRHIPKCEHMLHNKPLHMRLPKPRR